MAEKATAVIVRPEMGMILYRCPDDFPAKIPGILASMPSPAICEGGSILDSELECLYRYDVKRGRGRIGIYGSREEGEMSVAIVNGSLNPLWGRASFELSNDITKALLDSGMVEVTNEELEEFESRRKRKEAEQAGSPDGNSRQLE